MSKIIHKKSSVATKVPLTTDLEYGELALNYTDGKLYYLNSNNTIQSIAGSGGSGAVDSVAGKTGVVTLTKSDVGLGNVDNTADTAKPISTAQQTALDLKANTSSLANSATTTASTTAIANQIVLRDGSGNDYRNYGFGTYFNMSHAVDTARTTDTVFYSSTDDYIRKTNATSFRTSLNVPTRTGGDASGTWGISITGSAASITGTYSGTITSSQITTGLGFTPYNATNPNGYTTNTGTVTSVGGTGTTSGLTLSGTVTTTGSLTLGGTLSVTPSNFASQTANTVLAAPTGSAGTPTFRSLVALDIPNLDAAKITSGIIDSARLPSYVDDVVEGANLAAFPITGEGGKIYVALDTNKTYRWSGSAYVYITSGAVDSVAGKTGVVTLTATDVGLGNVSNAAQVTSVIGTAPIVSSGGTTPAISMAAATASVNGYMTSVYATKLDGISGTNTGDETTATIKTKLGTTTVGLNFASLTNPSSIAFTRINADNSVSTLDASAFRTSIASAGTASSNTFTLNQVIEATDNTNAALRVTQLGTGNALLIEDSTNPDSTPFVINGNGGVVSGHTSLDSNWYSPSNTPQIIQVASTVNGNRQGFASISYTGAPGFSMFRANGGILGTESAVISGDSTGILTFAGYDGTTSGAIPTAFIQSQVDSTPGVGSMPGRLTFSTTADGAIVPTERIRIASTGAIGLSGANYGTSGQVLTSAGSGASPTWTTIQSTAVVETPHPFLLAGM